jgi:hypothetical protein
MPRGYRAIAALKWTSLGVFSALSELPEISTQMPTASMVSATVRAPAHEAGALLPAVVTERLLETQAAHLPLNVSNCLGNL